MLNENFILLYLKGLILKLILILLFFIKCSLPNGSLNSRFSTLGKNTNFFLSIFAINEANSFDCKNTPNSFWARNLLTTSGASYCVETTLVGSSSVVELYLEKNLVTDLNYFQIVLAFSRILEIEKETISEPSDINKDGKISIVILDIKDGATPSSGFIAGYVDPINFFIDNPAFSSRSNEREILFMDGVELVNLRRRDLSQGRADTFLSTLAHELQHLIRFPISNGIDDVWIDEGTSELISDITGYGPQTSRINCFKGDVSSSISCSGGVGALSSNSPSLLNWRGTLKNYAFSYSFMKYLYSVAGTNEASRRTFLKNSVIGIQNTRATNILGLMNIFKNSNNFNSNLLSSEADIVFKRLFGNFMALSVGYNNLNTSYFGNSNIVSLESIRSTYPLPTDLNSLATPIPFSAVSDATSFNLSAGQVLRVNGTTSGITNNQTDFIAIQGTTSYLVMNASTVTGNSNTVNINIHDTKEKICPHDFFQNEFLKFNKIKNLKSLIQK